MGFIQKLAKRNPRVYEKKIEVEKPKQRKGPRLPRLTLRYILNYKNW
tara:strand:+ start:1706 stop:1846 length:141 start_codon:yes stop_codon:yes gene_type:complete